MFQSVNRGVLSILNSQMIEIIKVWQVQLEESFAGAYDK